MKSYEILFEDLIQETQEELLEFYGGPDELPIGLLAIIDLEESEEMQTFA